MADQTCGGGFVDGNGGTCSHNVTFLDIEYPATGTFTCDTIDLRAISAGGVNDWIVGHGTISGNTFTVKHTVAIDVEGDSGSSIQYTSPGDFASFQVDAGDYLFFYSETDAIKPDRTSTPDPKGYGYITSDHTGDASFSFTSSDTLSIEVQLSGPALVAGGGKTSGLTTMGAR